VGLVHDLATKFKVF
jgi:hypothetical protein